MFETKQKSLLPILFLYFVGILVVLLLTLQYMQREYFWYFWDYRGFCDTWNYLFSQLQQNIETFFRLVVSSINADDYNVFPVILPIFFREFLVDLNIANRTLYISLLTVIYIPLLAMLLTLVFKQVTKNKSKIIFFSVFILFLLFPPFWNPTLRGYPDVVGLIFVSLTLLLVLKTNFLKEFRCSRVILLGIFIWLIFLSRRWYAYTVVSLFFTLPLLSLALFRRGMFERKSIINLLLNYFSVGLVSLLCVLVFQTETFLRIISTDYSVIYSAYSSGYLGSFQNVVYFLGLLTLSLVVFSSWIIFIKRKQIVRQFYVTIFCLVNLVISFILFASTQSPGVQHCLPFSYWVVLVISFGFFTLTELLTSELSRGNILRYGVMCSMVFGIGSVFFYAYFANLSNSTKFLPPRFPPLQMQNVQGYKDLLREISSLEGGKVAIFASSEVLNDDMMTSASSIMGTLNKVIRTSQVDLRDGISVTPYLQRYVVVTNPVQLHLVPGSQLVIEVPAKQIYGQYGIGKAYQEIAGPFLLSQNANAFIYEKKRNFKEEELEEFLTPFMSKYPEWQGNEKIFKSLLSIRDISYGDIWGHLDVHNLQISTHPGENTPTSFTWTLQGIDKLKITSTNTMCNTDDIIKIGISSSELRSVVRLPHGGTKYIDVTDFNEVDSTVVVEKNISSGCDALKIELIQN